MENPRALTQVLDLIDAGLLPADQAGPLAPVAAEFRIRLSSEMQRAITSPQDGVARQFLPDLAELQTRPEELHDPIGDLAHSPVKGLTHRYPDRVILAVTLACEVYCRFCFRREVVGETAAMPDDELEAAFDYIAAHPAIWEVILTGGDPLSLSARRIKSIVERLSQIPHVEIIRFHSRVPVVAPERISDQMVDALKGRARSYVVVHTNHAAEITPAAKAALARLADAGIPLVSQSVLLRGINDDAAVLEALLRELLRNRVTPYYLHHCDLARGTSHFRTTIAEGQAIMAALRGRMSGIGLPTYVLDIPGGFGKVPIGPDYLRKEGQGHQVQDWQGRVHRYDDPAR